MKQVIVVVVILALVADLAIFAGLGFGLGALSTTGGGQAAGYTSTPGIVYDHPGGGVKTLSFQTSFGNVYYGAQLLTSILATGQSTDIFFQTHTPTYLGNGCGSWSGIIYNNGQISSSQPVQQYYTISFSQTGVKGVLNGQPFGPLTGTSFTINTNMNTGYGTGGADEYYAMCNGGGLSGPQQWMDNNTLYLVGQYADSVTVTVDFHTQVSYFEDSLGWPASVATAPVDAVATATYRSGFASAVVLNSHGLAFNGGEVQVNVATGYGGFQVCLLMPAPRAGGNACDPEFANQSVPDGCSGCVVTWNVPEGASQNSTVRGWNTWTVFLSNEHQGGAADTVVGYASVTIDILAKYAPGLPGITFTTSNSQYYYPQVNDTVTLTVYANESSTSTPVIDIGVKVYYIQPGDPATFEPACSVWVTTGCPQFEYITNTSLSGSGGNAVGVFSFEVNPPAGSIAIGVEAEGFTANEQGSGIGFISIQITPNDCQNAPQCQKKMHTSIWEEIGPILLSIAIVLLGVLAALLLPVAWMRVTVVVVAVLGVVILYVFGIYTAWFVPGGIFNTGVG